VALLFFSFCLFFISFGDLPTEVNLNLVAMFLNRNCSCGILPKEFALKVFQYLATASVAVISASRPLAASMGWRGLVRQPSIHAAIFGGVRRQ
jgi:hypothetical protein